MKKKFLRTNVRDFKKFKRKKKQKWRRARGRHSKTREKRKSRPRKVEIGFKKNEKERGKIKGKLPVRVRNLEEADKVERGELVIISRAGKKKRTEIEKKIKERGGEILK